MQNVIREAALVAARGERADAIEDDVVHRAKCLDDGIVVKTMSPELEKQLRDKSINVYTKYKDFFSPGLVDKIKSA